jgi:TonB family protein
MRTTLAVAVAAAIPMLLVPVAGSAAGPATPPEGEPQVALRVTCSSPAVRAVIDGHRDELLGCYRAELAKRPRLTATSMLEWTVRADGRASPPEADEMAAETDDPALHDCVVARIAAWTFPRPSGGPVDVTLVASFSVKRGKATSPTASSPAKAAIQKAIASHAAEIEQCYQARLAERPKLQGKVVLRWVVEADGQVRDVSVADATTLQDHVLLECMKARVAGWRFSARVDGGSTVITYPWVFQVRTTP